MYMMFSSFRHKFALTASLMGILSLGACTTDTIKANKVVSNGIKDKGVHIAEFREDLTVPSDSTVEWWQKFSDATLDKLVQDARGESISVQIAESRLKQARSQGVATVAGYAPQITLSDKVTGSKDVKGSADKTNTAINTASLGASWELPLFGRLKNSMAGAKANRVNAELGLEAAKIAMVSDIAAAYFDLRASQIALSYLEDDAARAKTLLDISTERYRVGLISKTDLALTQSQYASIASQIPDAKIRLRAALDRITILRGLNPGELDSFLALKDGDGFLFKSNVPNVVSVPADFVRRRLDVRQAEQQAILQAANVGINQADLYPRVTLGGAISIASSAVGNPMPVDVTTNSYFPSVSLPLFDFGQRWASVKVAGQQFRQSMLTYKLTVLNALAEGQQALLNYNEGSVRLAASMDNEQAAMVRLRAAEKSYEVGLISMKERIDAERDYSSARQQRLASQAKYSDTAIGIYRTFAGSPEVVK